MKRVRIPKVASPEALMERKLRRIRGGRPAVNKTMPAKKQFPDADNEQNGRI